MKNKMEMNECGISINERRISNYYTETYHLGLISAGKVVDVV